MGLSGDLAVATLRILKEVTISDRPSRLGASRWARLAYLRADLSLDLLYLASASALRRSASCSLSCFCSVSAAILRRERGRHAKGWGFAGFCATGWVAYERIKQSGCLSPVLYFTKSASTLPLVSRYIFNIFRISIYVILKYVKITKIIFKKLKKYRIYKKIIF